MTLASRRGLPGAALVLVLAAARASACGHCIEDRIAVVYDYGVEQQARRAGLEIAYLGIDGATADGEKIRDVLAAEPAIDRGTVRIAADPPAAAFAWDPRQTALAGLLGRLNGRLATTGAKLVVLKTWNAQRGLH